MLGQALCLVLILQCVQADGHNSVEEIIDRIGDYADTLGLNTDRDEFFWEEEYWWTPFQHVMKCPDGFEWQGNFTDGFCEPCPAGHFSNDDFGLKSRCIPCPPGEYDDGKEREYCDQECEYEITFKTGATSKDECVNPDEMFGEGSFQSEVSVQVDLSGDWSFLNDILMEASGINLYEARASVHYYEEDHVSLMHVRAILPNNIAVHAYQFLLQFKAYKDSFNDYSALADHYTKIIFDMLNSAETLKEFGWKMNHEQLRVKDAEILNVYVDLKQQCEDGYRSTEWEGVGTKCVRDNKVTPSYDKSVFIKYEGESQDCMSLGGEARLRDFVHNNWTFPCMENDECEAHFTTCRTISFGKCAIMVHLIFYDEEAGMGTVESNLNKAREVEYYDDTTFTYSEENPYKFRDNSDCGADPKIESDGSFTCSKSCDSENGYRFTRSGNCQQCPYGTWFDREESSGSTFPRCHSCSFSQSATIFGHVPKSADKCLNGGYSRTKNSDGVWTEWGRSIQADMEFKVDATVDMHLCEVMEVKERFDNFCSDKFSMEKMSLDDFTDYDVEMLGCMVMEEFSEVYEHSCKNFELSWSDIMDDFEWEDVACFVAKGIHKIEEGGVNCEYLTESDQRLTMPFEFSESFDDVGWSSAFYLPLFSHVSKMDRFQTNVVSGTVEGLFRKLGMYEMSKLTNLEMMNHVRDMILAVPRGLSVKESTFDFTTSDDDIYCDDGSVRVRCWDDKCYDRRCNNDNYEEEQLDCQEDSCNGCQVFWTFEGQPVECATEEKAECSAPNEIQNGRLFKMYDQDYVSRSDLCEGCENPVTSYKYVCDEGFRLDNIRPADESENGEEDYYGNDRCDAIDIYCKSTDNQLNQEPNCVRDTCQYDELENGYITKIDAEGDSPCRCAEYRCNPGYEMEGDEKVYCSVDGSRTEMPRCRRAECQFPKEMENARFVTEYLDYGDREGWYQCLHGTRDYDDVYDSVRCGDESTDCENQNYCPAMIENGYLMREWWWEQYDTYIGEYRCHDGFEMRNPQIFSTSRQDYEEKYGWGACGEDRDESPDPENMPRCVKPGSPEPCNMPKDIFNGYRVEEINNELYDMIDQARYRCNNGFMMVETWKGDIGWCRNDGTFELPYCVTPKEYFTVDFELVPGISKMENAGRVRARHVYADGSAGEWYAGCDDHFNGPAAGAICRYLGFRHGKQITADKKMKPISDLPFGKTNVYCYHDDTLITSPSCNADDYGQLGWPLCTPEEQMAVQCFDEMWRVDVGFNMVERNGKMSCPVKVLKEGGEMKLKNMDVHVKWGGVHLLAGDDYETEYFEEGVHYESTGKYSKKKGFRARFIGNKMDYDCYFCDIYMGDHIMNPWPDKNHNCPTDYNDENGDMNDNMNNNMS